MQAVQKFGIPLAMLHAAKGAPVRLELANRERWSGTVVGVDENGNVDLANATHEFVDPSSGAVATRQVEAAMIRGQGVLFVQLPQQEMVAQFPMLRLAQRGVNPHEHQP